MELVHIGRQRVPQVHCDHGGKQAQQLVITWSTLTIPGFGIVMRAARIKQHRHRRLATPALSLNDLPSISVMHRNITAR